MARRRFNELERPDRPLIIIGIFVAAVCVLVAFLLPPITDAFMANPVFNGLIVAILVIGLAVNVRQVIGLYGEVRWIDDFRRKDPERPPAEPTRLLRPMARMLGQRERARLSLSALSLRALLDSIRARLDESREVSRYLIGLLIFLGLLGTFWGLLATVRDVGLVISGMEVGGDSLQVFDRLREGLEGPLTGMGIAFSSSLFGLAGSLMLGFVDLQAGHAQNQFFNELEEWLAGSTRLAGGQLTEAETAVPAYVQALLEQTADGLETLQRTLTEQAATREHFDSELKALTRRLDTLVDELGSRGLEDSLRSELRLLNRTLAAALSGKNPPGE